MSVVKNYFWSIGNLVIFSFIILLMVYWTSDVQRLSLLVKKQQITKVTGLILARCGSKGVPMKNIALINGISLLQRSLKVMQEFGKFDDIWISTDCQKVADNAKEFMTDVRIHWRDPATATDSASSLIAVKEFSQKHPEVEAIALIQCTSPFLKKIWLEKAFNMIVSQEYDSVFSVVRQHKFLWEFKEDETIKPVNFDPSNRPRRQEWKGLLVETGMFYFLGSEIIKQNLLQGGRIGVVEVFANHSIEIDTKFDLELARHLSSILNLPFETSTHSRTNQHN